MAYEIDNKISICLCHVCRIEKNDRFSRIDLELISGSSVGKTFTDNEAMEAEFERISPLIGASG